MTGVAAVLVLFAGAGGAAYPLVDGDGDGVNDEIDQCLYSPPGVRVGEDGCSNRGDEDEDGVPETADACPRTPVGARVDKQGCALDEDVDGVADGLDRCPGTALGGVVTRDGCRKDDPSRVADAKRRPLGAPVVGRAPGAAGEHPPASSIAYSARAPIARVTPPPAPPPIASAAPPPAAPPSSPVQPATPVAPPVPERVASRGPAQLSVVPVQPGAVSAQGDGEHYLSIQFAPGRAELSSEWRQLLAGQVASINALLEQRPATQMVIVGYADEATDGAGEQALAVRRASVVGQALADMAVPSTRLSVRTAGARETRYSGAEAARNRRADLFLYDSSPPAPVAAPSRVTPAVPVAAAVPVSAPAPVRAMPEPDVAPPAPLPIAFGHYSAELDAASTRALDAFADACVTPLRVNASSRIVVAGGTAPEETGPAAAELAKARAVAIRTYLVSLGLPRERVVVDPASGVGAVVRLSAG